MGVVARDHVVGFGGMEISADGWFQAGEGRDSLCGEVLAESGAGSGKLLQRCQGIAQHGVQVEFPGWLIEAPQGFHIIGIQFE